MKYHFTIYIFISLLFSCSEDQPGMLPGPGTETGREITRSFTLSVPGMAEVSTRAMADNEYSIREIDVLVFHGDQYLRLASGRDLVKTAQGYQFETSLLATSQEVRLFFIANISATLHENIARLDTLGIPIDAALAKELAYVRYENFISRRDVFPMSGELRLEHGLQDNTILPEIKMMRAFARVDVVAHENTANRFQLEKATAYRMNDLFQIAPDDNKFSSDEKGNYIRVTAPSVPSEAVKIYKSEEYVAMNSKISNIYLPESESCNPETDQPTCLIIQGSYQNSSAPSYYRVDLGPKGSAGEVIRNHKYTLTITSVTGPGKPTIEEALQEASEDINTYIIWEEDGSHTIYDKEGKYLTTSKRTFSLHFAKAAMDTVSIETNFADTYTLEWADENGDPIGDTPIGPGENMSNTDFKVRISSDGKTIYATALKENDGNTHKIQRLFGRVGSILFTMTIEQRTRGERSYIKLYNPLGIQGDLGDMVMNHEPIPPIGGSLLRDLICNETHFGANGTVSFDGFKISGQNYQLPITTYLIRMFDVLSIGNNHIDMTDSTTVSVVKQWLEDSSNNKKVLVVYTSNETLVNALGAVTDKKEYYFSYKISVDATDTFLKGPFGNVNTHTTITNKAVESYYFLHRTNNPHLTPLLTDPEGNSMVIAADINRRILYMSDHLIFDNAYGLLTGEGKIETDLDRLLANTWAWIAETVLGDIYDPEIPR